MATGGASVALIYNKSDMGTHLTISGIKWVLFLVLIIHINEKEKKIQMSW